MGFPTRRCLHSHDHVPAGKVYILAWDKDPIFDRAWDCQARLAKNREGGKRPSTARELVYSTATTTAIAMESETKKIPVVSEKLEKPEKKTKSKKGKSSLKPFDPSGPWVRADAGYK